MLVLSRKKDQIVDIPGVGTVMVIEIRGDKVRLGFDLDPEFKIYRREVWLAIQRQDAAAGSETGAVVEIELLEGAADEEAAEVSH